MRIAIVGCGAMGSVYAALLADAGNEVLAIDRWEEHVEAMNAGGLHVEGASGDRTVKVAASTAPPAGPVDMIVVAVKAADAAAAAEAARPLLGPETLVVTIQNGLGSAEGVAAALGADRLMVGIAGGFGASFKGPGHVHHNGMKTIRMGAYAGLPYDRVEAAVQVWRDAGFAAEPARDIAVMQWEKLICNVAYSAPCTLTGLTIGQVMEDPDMGPISRAAATEAWEVARAAGIALTIEDPVDHVRTFGAAIPNAKPSLLLDFEAGRRGEIDFINGAIPREAEKLGRRAPVNATLVGLVRFRERGF
ncbi:ketopantoate reductase family protein [Pelagibius marinus]|uniref:ketopantoate reductase family protein n=1 Tax=Pelagibius marinus TaxID=2762760 RepID=UPI0018732B41|nr:2-dehydropantoate 2-reductase [Pelagibius marinus]